MAMPESPAELRDPTLFGVPGSAGRRAVLFVHGWNSSQAGYRRRAKVIARDLDAICLTFDLRGHGRDAENLDRYGIEDHLDDVRAAYDYLVSRHDVDPTRVGVSGASYGGYLAALLTADRAVKRLALRAPTLAPSRRARSRLGTEPAAMLDMLDSLKVLRRYAGEVLVIESERDELIPRSTILEYVHAAPHSRRHVIPDATHALTNPVWDDIFVEAITRWFRQL